MVLLETIKRRGGQDASALARRLGITRMAVGLHLSALKEEDLVRALPVRGKSPRRGRPEQAWHLTEAAHCLFPDAHAPLAAGILTALGGMEDGRALGDFLRLRTRQQVEQYRRLASPDASLRKKVMALARARATEGYMAEVEAGPAGSVRLVENHCPICSAARACRGQGLCESERKVFARVLGPGVSITREEHILSGARRCAYSIRQAARPSQKGGA